MRPRLLQLLACPECRCPALALDAFAQENDEVLSGLLVCEGCGRKYPVIGGVPRLLPDELLESVRRYHPGFFQQHELAARNERARSDVARTLDFYSFARSKLFTPAVKPDLLAYWQQSLKVRIPGAPNLSGSLGLDAGCGEGRYSYCLAVWGAEVIGLDLSEAVSLAYRRNKGNPRVHIVQGSIYHPPIRDASLNFVVSTGVLHHLPDPERGFAALAPLVRPGGSIRIWVYGLHHMSSIYRLSHLVFLRRFASNLSPRASYLVSVPIGLVLHLLLFRPVRRLARFTALKDRLPVQLRELAALPLQLHVAEVQDRIGVPITHFLTGAELRAWYERAGLQDVRVEPTGGGRGWSASGVTPQAS